MLPVPLFSQIRDVLCLGAHCDDVEIGCGGTLAALTRANPHCRVRIVTFSGNATRRAESRTALQRLVPTGSATQVEIHDFRDGFFPAQWSDIKGVFEAMKGGYRPDVVLTHHADDRHQDHRVVCELAWNTFRDSMMLEYEIPKWDGDLGRPQVYVPLQKSAVDLKLRTLDECFPSQRERAWFSADVFTGLMRLRGMECNAPDGFAEAFHVRKLVLAWR
ncbi:MAG: PIG-L deacetylase family protein [Pseudomonadota bacterium]|jgi:LmbE family N-acetylglucosaminyl deacetylase|nr:MAG: PIG-L domain-containing protein [Pseudomonadota bacterium]